MILDSSHYTPILKSRAGQRNAVRGLTNARKDKVVPLFEIVLPNPDHKDRIPNESVKDRIARLRPKQLMDFNSWSAKNVEPEIQVAWGQRPAIVDLGQIGDTRSKIIGLRTLMQGDGQQGLWDRSLNLIAGIGLHEPNEYLDEVAKPRPNKYSQVMICIRVYWRDLQNPDVMSQQLSNIYNRLGIGVERAYLLIDLGGETGPEIYAKAMSEAQAVANINNYAGLIFASGSIPMNLSGYDRGKASDIVRHDWHNWQNHANTSRGQRAVTFADHTIRYPGDDHPAQFFAPTAKLIYTVGDKYLLFRGQVGELNQFPHFANALHFMGAANDRGYSQGDAFMATMRDHLEEYQSGYIRELQPGNVKQWMSAAINHHMSVVVDQIANPHTPTPRAPSDQRASLPTLLPEYWQSNPQ